MALRWFWSICHGRTYDSGRGSNGENRTAQIVVTSCALNFSRSDPLAPDLSFYPAHIRVRLAIWTCTHPLTLGPEQIVHSDRPETVSSEPVDDGARKLLAFTSLIAHAGGEMSHQFLPNRQRILPADSSGKGSERENAPGSNSVVVTNAHSPVRIPSRPLCGSLRRSAPSSIFSILQQVLQFLFSEADGLEIDLSGKKKNRSRLGPVLISNHVQLDTCRCPGQDPDHQSLKRIQRQGNVLRTSRSSFSTPWDNFCARVRNIFDLQNL